MLMGLLDLPFLGREPNERCAILNPIGVIVEKASALVLLSHLEGLWIN